MRTTRERYTKREKAARDRLIEAATELAAWSGRPLRVGGWVKVPANLLTEVWLANDEWQEAQLAHHAPGGRR